MKKLIFIAGLVLSTLLLLPSCSVDEAESTSILEETSSNLIPKPNNPTNLIPVPAPPHGDDDQDKDKTKP